MHTETHEVLKFSTESSPAGDRLVGSYGYATCTGSAGIKLMPWTGGLGAEPLGGTVTGALRQFNLPTSRAPGDWPEPTRHQVRY